MQKDNIQKLQLKIKNYVNDLHWHYLNGILLEQLLQLNCQCFWEAKNKPKIRIILFNTKIDGQLSIKYYKHKII